MLIRDPAVTLVLLSGSLFACRAHAPEASERPAPFDVSIHQAEKSTLIAQNATYEQMGLGVKPGAGKVFVCVQFAVTNHGAAPEGLPAPTLIDGNGVKAELSVQATGAYPHTGWDADLSLAEVAPGATVKRADCFEVPETATVGAKLALVRTTWGKLQGWTATTPLPEVTTTAAEVPAAKPAIALETSTYSDKDRQGALNYSLQTPVGWASKTYLGGARTFEAPSGTPEAMYVGLRVMPSWPVRDAKGAAHEVGMLDVAHLDTIAQQRTLGPSSFLVETAPRGPAKLISVTVFTSGKKRSMMAKCSGTADSEDFLTTVCSSLKVD